MLHPMLYRMHHDANAGPGPAYLNLDEAQEVWFDGSQVRVEYRASSHASRTTEDVEGIASLVRQASRFMLVDSFGGSTTAINLAKLQRAIVQPDGSVALVFEDSDPLRPRMHTGEEAAKIAQALANAAGGNPR